MEDKQIATDAALGEGSVLAGKYQLESVLGVGGMGTVYRAQHLALNAPVAIKVIDREVEEGDVALARFMQEAQSAAALRSPHVVQILDYGMEGNRPFMVMEMLEGETLSERLKREGRLGPADTFRIMSHVARAMAKAHEAAIIHRDLKPDNIFIIHNAGDEIAKVLDFGVAKVDATALDGEGHTRTGSLLGTPYYMSPEQAQGIKELDSRSDLWALGVIAFETLTGKRPFSSEGLGDLVLQICIRDIPRPSEITPVPAGFDEWFEKACGREPEERFQTARELAEALEGALGLKNDTEATAPASRWSTNVAMPFEKAEVHVTPTFGTETTQDAAATDAGTTERDVAATDAGATERDHATRRNAESDARTVDETPTAKHDSPADAPRPTQGSQWEILPRDARASVQPIDDPLLNPGYGQSGAGKVLFVALAALLVGGAVVIGMKQAGVEVPGYEEDTKAPRPAVTAKKLKGNQPDKQGGLAKKSPTKERKKSSKKSRPQSSKSAIEGPTGENALDPEKKKTADDSLTAIEGDAKKALDDRDLPDEAVTDGQEIRPEKGSVTPPPEEGSTVPSEKAPPVDPPTEQPSVEKQGEGSEPEPRVPEGLSPPPAPPKTGD